MKFELVRDYLRDSAQAYEACATSLEGLDSAHDLFALIRAARSGNISRRGELSTQAGVRFSYHVHGSGYSFVSLASGRQINFDVCIAGERQCVRFTTNHLQVYAFSVGKNFTQEEVQIYLDETTLGQLQIEHVTDAGFDYYCYPMSFNKD